MYLRCVNVFCGVDAVNFVLMVYPRLSAEVLSAGQTG